jgi:hypothetical protein
VKKMPKTQILRSFGVFSPAGYVVMAFKTRQDAGKARKKLLAAGFGKDVITEWSADEVLANVRKARRSVLAMVSLGQEVAQLEKYFALAKQGSGFIVVYAPSESESKRAVTLVRKLGLQLAEKYNRFTLEEVG